LWPIATGDILTARRRFQGIAGHEAIFGAQQSVANDVVDDARCRHRMCQRVIVEQRIT
jgi:hypothetical protein